MTTKGRYPWQKLRRNMALYFLRELKETARPECHIAAHAAVRDAALEWLHLSVERTIDPQDLIPFL